ncbi:MAG: cation:proton antiporter, partial [Nanoarchaeota archaeon]
VDPEKHIYFEIVFLLLLAVLAEVAVFYFKLQSVIVLMILGIFIGPSFLTMAWDFLHTLNLPIQLAAHAPEIIYNHEIIRVFAQLGAIILLFKVGLHSKIETLFSKENIITAVIGIILPFVAGYFYAVLTGGSFAYSMFVGAALAATSVGVTVAILKEMNILKKKFAEVIIGAAIIDDILALLLLSVVINLVGHGSAGSSVIITFISAAIFIAGAIITGKYFIGYIDKKEMGQKRLLLSLAFMLLLAYVAEIIQLSAIVGAFLAGIILNKSKNCHIIEEKTFGIELLFTPIFFISLGILIDLKAIITLFIPIIIITAIALLTKIIAGASLAFFSKLNFNESLLIGIGMAPRGEVALIIASIGLTKGILPTAEYSVISAMALLTSFVAPPILAYFIKRSKNLSDA